MGADIVQFHKHITIGVVRSSFKMEVALPYTTSFVTIFGAQESLCIPVDVPYEVDMTLFSGKVQHGLGDFRSFLGRGSPQYFWMNIPIPLFSGIHLMSFIETTLYGWKLVQLHPFEFVQVQSASCLFLPLPD